MIIRVKIVVNGGCGGTRSGLWLLWYPDNLLLNFASYRANYSNVEMRLCCKDGYGGG